jgi:alkanesulfonate monooxygenase SsuD/methylene tetrahydromethanopterin reductase-like flavin-dependent oxidoreductase (luciferase family)
MQDSVKARAERVRLGVMLLPVAAPFERLEATARAADEHGFDAVWCFDHLDTPHAEPGAPTYDVYEGWTTATVLAARTERVRVGHNVLAASFRHPALLAKMAATFDAATGGRLELGIGWGSMPAEFRRFGFGVEPAAVRAARLRETLEILQLMFAGEPFSYEGEHYIIPDAVGRPTPVQARIPVHIGGAGPTLTMPLVAEFADWWNVPASSADRLEELRPLAGRARVSMQCVVGLAASSNECERVADQARVRFGDWSMRIIGTPDDVIAGIRALVARGVEQLVIQFHDYGRPETLALFGREVRPAVTA